MNDLEDNVPTSKKTKQLGPMDTVDNLGMHSDVQVMNIDDVSDPYTETLNKTNPMANIKFFFTPTTPVGQTKTQMCCNLCMWVALCFLCVFICNSQLWCHIGMDGCSCKNKILTNEQGGGRTGFFDGM